MANNEAKKQKPTKEKKLSHEMISKISEVAAETAVKTYIKEAEKEKERFRDNRFKNTKLLLKKYRWLSDYVSNAIYETSQMMDENMEVIFEALGADMSEVRKVQSIKNGVTVTSIIIEHVNTMLDCYMRKCISSERPEVSRRWRVIDSMYLDGETAITAQEIADRENISLRMVYEDIDKACEDLSTLFFGIDLTIM